MQPIRECYLTVLVEIEQQLLTCHDLHSCYDKVLECIGQAVGASCSYLVEAIQNAVHPFSSPIAEWCADQNRCLLCRSGQGLDWQKDLPQSRLANWMVTLQQGKSIVERLPSLPSSQGHQPLMRPSVLVLVPLLVHGKLYGAIGIEHWQEETAEIPELETLALQMLRGVAIALSFKLEQLYQQTLLKELSHHVQQLDHDLENATRQHMVQLQKSLSFEALLKRITDRVRDSLDEHQILQTAVQELATGLGTYSCDAALYDLEQGTSTIAYEYINCEEISPARGTVFCLASYPTIYAQLLQGTHLQFCWITPPTTSRSLKTRLVVLGCPIIDDQGVIGDIWLYDSIESYFEIEEVRLVEQVANQCAIALRQARLYQKAQAQVQELEHLNYLKDDFLNTVSHELRSPMANIEMAIQMLELLLFNPPSLTESTPAAALEPATEQPLFFMPHPSSFQQSLRYFRILQDECVRETNLINDLLDLSRLEAGTEPIFLTTIHLQSWIPHVVEPFLERARNQQQHLQIDISQDLPPVSTDLSGLERVLTELIHNACKYTPSGEKIHISAQLNPGGSTKEETGALSLSSQWDCLACTLKRDATPAADLLSLRISNSGVEISPLELPRIFDKFYRIPSNDPWKHGGTGLGLALVKRLVEHLGATIEVESSHNQVTFTIVFPYKRGGSQD